jgi:hypothetical protein
MASACFAAIVRTMGDRPQLLQQALESLTFQQDRCRAIVVVHGDSSAHQKVQQVCRRVGGLEYVTLHAKDTGKRRGHPPLSEFRIIRDGNREIKTNPALWKQYSLQIRKQINRSGFVVPGAKLA